MPWQAVDSRARGVKHLERGIPCQDYSAYKHLSEDHIIGAISDGMGSAKHSDLGSKVAVETAIFELSQVNWQPLERGLNPYARTLFSSVLEAVRLEISNQANRNSYQVEDLACTLIVFSATPHQLIAMQVGDGLLVVRSEGGDYKLLFEPDKGEFANETTSVTSTNAQDEMKVEQTEPYQFICAATDGIENISLIKSEKWKPSPKFFQPLEQHILCQDNDIQKKEKLEAFLNSDRINQNTDDDKTILLCAYRKAYPHVEKEEQNREISNDISSNTTKKNKEDLLEKGEVINTYSFKEDDFDVHSSQQNRLSKQELRMVESQIFYALNQLNGYKLFPRLRESKNPGYLGVWLPSGKKLSNQKKIAGIICQIVINLNRPHIKQIEIFNSFKSSTPAKKTFIVPFLNPIICPLNKRLNSSQKFHWVERLYLKESSNLARAFLSIAIILYLILVIFPIFLP